jgi:hypothetical protein
MSKRGVKAKKNGKEGRNKEGRKKQGRKKETKAQIKSKETER